MFKINLLMTFIITFSLGCTKFSSNSTEIQKTDNPIATPILGAPVTGNYCTLKNNFRFGGDSLLPITITCIQENGLWKDVAGFPESQPVDVRFISYFNDASLTKASNGDLLLSYKRYVYSDSDSIQVRMTRYNSVTGWTTINNKSLNIDSQNQVMPLYTQFGGSNFEINSVPFYFWTQPGGGLLSTPKNGEWFHIALDPSLSEALVRHPEVFMTSTKTYALIHIGEPRPEVWKFDGIQLVKIGEIPFNSAQEYTLYSSVTEFNGQPAIAFTSANWALVNAWTQVKDQTKIFLYNGTSWDQLSSDIQDTAGHDGVTPFLFVSEGFLHVMYSDYSTTGLPTNSSEISFRFRVKKWNGTTWQLVTGESDVIYLSQRFEFLNDNGNIFVNVTQPNPNGSGSRQVVLTWNKTGFNYLGSALQTWPDKNFNWEPRPGAVIKL